MGLWNHLCISFSNNAPHIFLMDELWQLVSKDMNFSNLLLIFHYLSIQ